MLDELLAQPISQGDIFANANTIILMGRTRHNGRLGRALSVVKHRGSACGEEILPYRIAEEGFRFEMSIDDRPLRPDGAGDRLLAGHRRRDRPPAPPSRGAGGHQSPGPGRGPGPAGRPGPPRRAAGGSAESAIVAAADVSDPAAVAAMMQADRDREWRYLDILVNNAGILRDRSIGKMTLDEWRSVLDVDSERCLLLLQVRLGNPARRGLDRLDRQPGGEDGLPRSVELRGGQGGRAGADASAGPRVRPSVDPGQRGGAGRDRHGHGGPVQRYGADPTGPVDRDATAGPARRRWPRPSSSSARRWPPTSRGHVLEVDGGFLG